MKNLFSMIALVLAFSSGYAQTSPLTVINTLPTSLTVTVIAGHVASCGGIQNSVIVIPAGATTTFPAFTPGAPLTWLAVCNNSSGTCDTYFNTVVPNSCLGNMPGNPTSTMFTGTWINANTLRLTP